MQNRIILPFLLLFFFTGCDKSNKTTFEEFADIRIPTSIKVFKDEYQDMGQDVGKVLEFQINDKSKSELELSVIKSLFFNSSAYIENNVINPELLHTIDNKKGVWYRTSNGYAFYGSTIDERSNVTANIDTLRKLVRFKYLFD